MLPLTPLALLNPPNFANTIGKPHRRASPLPTSREIRPPSSRLETDHGHCCPLPNSGAALSIVCPGVAHRRPHPALAGRHCVDVRLSVLAVRRVTRPWCAPIGRLECGHCRLSQLFVFP